MKVDHYEYMQLRFPRSKKKRIQKKWRKNPRNWGNVAFYKFSDIMKEALINKWETEIYEDFLRHGWRAGRYSAGYVQGTWKTISLP